MIKENLEKIKSDIDRVMQECGREGEAVTLIAVSKMKPAESIKEAYAAGQRVFGENWVQELCAKMEALPGEDISWHLIGHLQTNKVKYVVGKVALIHSVDSLHLAEAIGKEARKRDVVQDVLLEVNAGGEESKFGLTIEETPYIIDKIKDIEGIRVRGLMTVAPPAADSETVRPVFRAMKKLFDALKDRYSLDILSMGMSGDYPAAISEGANMIRIGSAIFGKRDYQNQKK